MGSGETVLEFIKTVDSTLFPKAPNLPLARAIKLPKPLTLPFVSNLVIAASR